jgi:outer membrane protein TolC
VAVAQALRNRSQMRSLELDEIMARRQVSEARLNTGFGMTVSATAGYNQTAPIFDDAYRSLLDQQRLTVAVEMPLVQWGGRRAQVQAARAEEDRVTALSRDRRGAVEQDARFAALQLPLARRQLATSAKADTVATRRFDVAKNRYIIGRIDIGDLYIAQSEKDAALLSYVEALRSYWLAYYRLRRLTLYDFEGARPLVP